MLATYAAHGHRFSLRVDDPPLARYLAELYRPLSVAVEPTGAYTVEGRDPWCVAWEGTELASSPNLSFVLSVLQWHINQQVIAQAAATTMVHAAGAVRDGGAIVLPAQMEAGKSTLVGALVRAGWAYLSDEAVAIQDGLALPYAKPLSLDRGSWPLHEALRPPAVEGLPPLDTWQWQVAVHAIRSNAIATPAPVTTVVFPRYLARSRTVLEPIEPADALAEMATSTFRWADAPARHLDTLAAAVRGARCWRLQHSDLDEAVAAIDEAAAVVDDR